jgi:hypothetical protein
MIEGVEIFHNHNREQIIREAETMPRYTVMPEPENIFVTNDHHQALAVANAMARITGKMHTICVDLNRVINCRGLEFDDVEALLDEKQGTGNDKG